jgi:2-methylisocitrate lyase-like PEP mutase family enzyme
VPRLVAKEIRICPVPVRGSAGSFLARRVSWHANIFDPLSARIADMLGYEVCVLSGSVGKAANLGVPDIVLSNMSDVVDHPEDIMWTLLRPILL